MEVYSLDNGLNYILEKRKDTGVVAVQVWVKVGSKDEDDRVAGITHFIEHLIFKGTDKLPGNAFASKIEAIGGSVNAFTSFDNTVYHIVIPSHSFREGFELLVESVKNPAFPSEEIAKERKVILEEIKMGEDDPQRKLFKELFSLSYHGEAYGKPVIGFKETVEKISREDITDYFHSHYLPGNMTVVIVGDFDKKEASNLITKHLSEDKGRFEQPFREISQGEAQTEEKLIIERDVREQYLAVSYGVQERMHHDIPAIDVLGVILGDGESSRLQDVLKNRKGIVNGVSTYLFSPKKEGLFIVYANYTGQKTETILSALDAELDRVRRYNVKDWELTKAKNMLKAQYIYTAETVQGRARQIGDSKTITNDHLFIEKYLKAIDAVSKDDVKRVAREYLDDKKRRLVVMKPKITPNPYKQTLKNGMVSLVNKNDSSPSFSFRIAFPGGLKDESPEKNGELNILSRMLLKGTKKKSSSQIAKEIDLLAGSLAPFNGRNLFGLSGRFLSKDLRSVMSLLRELLMETKMRGDDFETVRREVLSDLRQRDDDPIGFTFTRFNEAFYSDHPYGRDPIGNEDDVKKMSLSDIEDAYGRFVTPGGAVLAISGDVDENEVFSLIESLFANWRGESRALQKISNSPKGKEVSIERDILQTHIVFGFQGPGLIDKERYATEVLDAILSGMGGRIHRVLREENPYAYALTFFNQMAYETGAMGIYIGTSTNFVDDVKRIAREEIEKIRNEGFSEKEVEDGKRYLVGNHYIRMQSNGAMASSMCFDTLYGLPPGYFKKWPSMIETVTKDDVNNVAAKYLSLEHMVQLLVGKIK